MTLKIRGPVCSIIGYALNILTIRVIALPLAVIFNWFRLAQKPELAINGSIMKTALFKFVLRIRSPRKNKFETLLSGSSNQMSLLEWVPALISTMLTLTPRF